MSSPSVPIRFQLPNGARIVVETMPGASSIAAELSFVPGSRGESSDGSGLTHFCEHMLFKGTSRRDWQEISRIGNLHGGELNAMTTVDYVQLTTRVIPEDLGEALGLLVELARDSTFPQAELERERGVILEEISEYEDNPPDACAEGMTRVLFGDHPLGRPVLGTRQTVSSFSADTARGHWESTSDGSNAILSLAGAVTSDAVEAILAETVGAISSSGAASDTKPSAEGISAPLFHEERDIEQAQFCIGYRGMRRVDPRRTALVLMDTILGSGMGSRLFNEIREKRGLAYSVGSSTALHIDGGYVMIYGSTAPERLEEAIALCRDEIRKLTSELVPDDELETVRRMQQRLFRLHADHVGSRCARNTTRIVHGEPFLTDDEIVAKIQAVQPSHILSLANELFRAESGAVLSVVGPITNKGAANCAALLS